MKRQEANVRVYDQDILQQTFSTPDVYAFIAGLAPETEFSLFKNLVTAPDDTRSMVFSLNVYRD